MGTFIEDIAKRLKDKTDKFDSLVNKNKWKPMYLEKGTYTPPTFTIPKSRDYRIKNEFSKALTFVLERAQGIRKKDACTLMPIPRESPELNLIWSNVSRGKDFLIKIGLISEFNDKWRFNAGKFNYGKIYAYYYENELKLIEYCKNNNIKPLPSINLYQINVASQPINSTIQIDNSKIKIGGGLNIEKPKGMSCADFEDELTKRVHLKYPELLETQLIAKEINEKYYKNYPSFSITLRLRYKWNKEKTTITKIKLRATNSLCSLKEEDRKALLDDLGMNLESDVNCSVPRLNKSMNLGHWFSDGPNRQFQTDLYQLIFKEMYPNEQMSEEGRNAIKKLLLRTYFEKSQGTLTRDIWNNIDKTGLNKNDVDNEILLLDKAVKKVVGPVMLGSEIYYVEACVYLRVLKELLDLGHLVWLVYDGFYSSGVMMEELFDGLVQGIIENKFNEFFGEYCRNRGILKII